MNEHIWEILTDAFPKLLGYGVRVTIPLMLLSFALALVISILVALVQYANIKGLRLICRFYIWVVRGTPLLVQLYLIFYGLPKMGIVLDAFPCAVMVMGLNEAAYMAETVRGALESVSKGQVEAGRCIGLNYLQIMRHIVLPQAFRVAFPALSNSMISMTKETSLAATITVMEMFRQAQVINGRVYQPLALYTLVALIYLAFCTILTAGQHWGEKKLGSYGQTSRQESLFSRLFGRRKAV